MMIVCSGSPHVYKIEKAKSKEIKNIFQAPKTQATQRLSAVYVWFAMMYF
jgi:hypothetical protein